MNGVPAPAQCGHHARAHSADENGVASSSAANSCSHSGSSGSSPPRWTSVLSARAAPQAQHPQDPGRDRGEAQQHSRQRVARRPRRAGAGIGRALEQPPRRPAHRCDEVGLEPAVGHAGPVRAGRSDGPADRDRVPQRGQVGSARDRQRQAAVEARVHVEQREARRRLDEVDLCQAPVPELGEHRRRAGHEGLVGLDARGERDGSRRRRPCAARHLLEAGDEPALPVDHQLDRHERTLHAFLDQQRLVRGNAVQQSLELLLVALRGARS